MIVAGDSGPSMICILDIVFLLLMTSEAIEVSTAKQSGSCCFRRHFGGDSWWDKADDALASYVVDTCCATTSGDTMPSKMSRYVLACSWSCFDTVDAVGDADR